MGYSKDEHCSHGFRTSASTILNGTQRYNPDVIEMALAHEEKNEVRGAYNRAKYWMRIPTEAGRVFRREAGQGSGLKPATIPI
jgi:hypothetical protein